MAKLIFVSSGQAVKAHLNTWGIRRLKKVQELDLLAECLSYNRSLGRQVAFFRFGEPFPLSEIQAHLDINPKPNAGQVDLPGHLSLRITPDASSAGPSASEAVNTTATTANGGSEAQNADNAHSKKRKLAELPTRSYRPQQQTTAPRRTKLPARSRSRSRDNDSGNESEDQAKPATEEDLGKFNEALSTLRSLSKELGMSETTVNKYLQEQRLRKLAKSAIKRNEAQELFTDLGPVHHAARNDSEEIIALLLSMEGIDINAREGAGWTALHLAGVWGSFKAMQALVLHPDIDINARDDENLTPLVRAISGKE